ncbi:MAG: class I SAM-dependent methyltransferase [Nitrospinae bacterium]|nr:class I SAM-dependent methyltransferase [Nitrospinota bacterium]
MDYTIVNSYWEKAESSILGPYVMDGFGFPASAGHFRFRGESRIVQKLVRQAHVDRASNVLDLGSGVGHWAEYFAQKFDKIVAVETSTSLYKTLVQRCSAYDNITPILGDVLSFEPEDHFSLIFLGGLLMYLNEGDVIALLQKLKSFLNPGGFILCRESTVRNGTVTLEGDYQAVYRSVPTYHSLFKTCGLSVTQTCLNKPYVLMQMGCEAIQVWKENVPENFQCLPFIGRMVYWGLRLGNPWITHLPSTMGMAFPELTNHFFLVEPSRETSPNP